MFPLRKLHELSQKTRLRKVARILQAVEEKLAGTGRLELEYARELAHLLSSDSPEVVRQDALVLERALAGADAHPAASPSGSAAIVRAINVLRNDLLHELHAEPVEWDFVNHTTGLLSRVGVKVLPLRVYLEDVRSPFNVGSILRTA